VRALCAFDTQRDTYVSVSGDIGLVVNCAGVGRPDLRKHLERAERAGRSGDRLHELDHVERRAVSVDAGGCDRAA
jgi:hypothetical protein